MSVHWGRDFVAGPGDPSPPLSIGWAGPSSEAAQSAATARLSPRRVLIVEDDPAFRASLRLALVRLEMDGQPLSIEEAATAAEAETRLREGPPVDLVLLDVSLESDDAGLRLVRRIRRVLDDQRVRIVLLSADSGLDPMLQRTGVDRLDINDFCPKVGLDLQRLRHLVQGHLLAAAQFARTASAPADGSVLYELTRTLANPVSADEFARILRDELAQIVGVEIETIVVASRVGQSGAPLPNARIVCSVGLPACLLDDVVNVVEHTLDERRDQYLPGALVLLFRAQAPSDDYVCYVGASGRLGPDACERLAQLREPMGWALRQIGLRTRLGRAAYEDMFLQMPNRAALLSALESRDSDLTADLALLLVDIVGFSEINLAFGFGYGDGLLHAFADCLRRVFGSPSMVARLHDDVFAVLGPCDRVTDETLRHAVRNAEDPDVRRLDLVTARLQLNRFELTPARSLAMAALMLKMGKQGDSGRSIEFEPGMDQASTQAHMLLGELRDAIAASEIQVVYQPQIDLKSGRVIGVEALARWTRSDGTAVSPAIFVPIAERSGDIVPLADRVLDHICSDYRAMTKAGHRKLRVALNVSARQFDDPQCPTQLLDTISRRGLPAEALEVEMTESVAMRDFASIDTRCRQLHEAGVQLSIDDFGTGFCSLSYLSRLPFDCIKIDRSFVADVVEDGDGAVIAEMIIQLARRLGRRVLAEGIESDAQLRWLLKHGCRLGQGFGLARPMPCEELVDWLQRH